jgi:hypothetical protein
MPTHRRHRVLTPALGVLLLAGATARAAGPDFTVVPFNMSAWIINSQGGNPAISVIRGRTYTFDVQASGHPFWIKTAPESGTSNTYDFGVTNNGLQTGTLTWTVPASAPTPLYYTCQFHDPMVGTINVVAPPAVAAFDPAGRGVLVASLLGLGLAVIRLRRHRS